jgi:hypothetical protein
MDTPALTTKSPYRLFKNFEKKMEWQPQSQKGHV